jgi:hypothetical protein
MKRFIIGIAIISVLLALTGWLVFSRFIPQYYLPVLPFMLLFFIVASIIIHAYQLQLAKKDFAKFTRSNMLVTFIRLVMYSAAAIIYIAADTKNAKVFVVCFVICYLIFTVFEITSLIKISAGAEKNEKTK